MISESDIQEQLRNGINFPPLNIELSADAAELPTSSAETDLRLQIGTADRTYEFAAFVKAKNTPRAFAELLRQAQQAVDESCRPLLVVPYLREQQLEQLQQLQLSGVDLSGNGVVCVTGELLVYRTGNPNRYPDSAPTKYAYRGATSLVPRAFLCRSNYESLADIGSEIELRNGSVAISTVSKALKRLESDLIVDRSAEGYRLRQADKLLEQLAASYQPPKVTRTVTLSISKPLPQLLAAAGEQVDVALTGRSSVEAYAVMGRDEYPVLYTNRIDPLLQQWGSDVEEATRFIELELQQTTDPTVFFDARKQRDLIYASPVQTFLELASGDKREREVAEQIRDQILRELDN
jgi:DNA-binding transcriptional ArsR family regulator